MASVREERSQLQVLIANEHAERLERLGEIVRRLGYTVGACVTDPTQVALTSLSNHCDVALVGLGQSTEHALELIDKAVQEAACPVIAVLHDSDRDFVTEAARRGIFAAVVEDDADELQLAIEVALARFAAFRNLEGAIGRRAVIERAKGILMERHHLDEQEAFELLRSQARQSNRKLAELAKAVNDSHLLLPRHPPAQDPGIQGPRREQAE